MKISRVFTGYELLDDRPAVITAPATPATPNGPYSNDYRVDVTVSVILTRDELLKVME